VEKQVYDHVDQQYAFGLIGPLRDQVRVLEERAHHYVHHVRMSPDDLEILQRVHSVLANARGDLERLRAKSQ
jgi:hypothetical protein